MSLTDIERIARIPNKHGYPGPEEVNETSAEDGTEGEHSIKHPRANVKHINGCCSPPAAGTQTLRPDKL